MKVTLLTQKVIRGLPYLVKEARTILSDQTPFFVAVPSTVHIWRGAPCNGKCIMCFLNNLTSAEYKKHCTSLFTDDMMPQILNEIYNLCGRGTLVSYIGGEPTLNTRLIEWVKQSGKLRLDFRFTTNGYILDDKMAKELVKAGLYNIGISLESLDPTINETMRPYPGGTAKTIKCIELMLNERILQKKQININIKTVLTDINLESFISIVERFGKIEGCMCTPQLFESFDNLPKHVNELLFIKDNNRLQCIINKIIEMKKNGYNIHISEIALKSMLRQNVEDSKQVFTTRNKKIKMTTSAPTCNIATNTLWVVDGKAKLCPYHSIIGDYITNTHMTLKQMWKSKSARQIRSQTRACRRLCTLSCLRRTPLLHKVFTFLKMA